MAITKKQTFYELDPRYFKDYSGNGTGDFRGLATKMDYFEFVGIQSIILQNVLSSYTEDQVQNYTQVAKDLGDINDLKKVLSLSKEKGIKILMELPIGSIKDTHKWFKNATEGIQDEFNNIIDFVPNKGETTEGMKYSSENKSYYHVDEKTMEIPLNWKSEQVLEQFVKVIRFWTELGISGFVFTDFEYITDPSKKDLMSEATLKELRKFYKSIKEIDDNITVIAKSDIVPLKTSIYTSGATQVFDYFMPTQISRIGSDSKFGSDVANTFKPSKLIKALSTVIENKQNIVTFGSQHIGRVNARWGDKGQYSHESAKAIAMLLLLNPASSSVYYGDEIGSLNIGLTHLDDFQDSTLVARKQDAMKAGVKEKDFMQAQVQQNSINGRSLMAWNDEKNGGFSHNEKTITPVSSTYKEINVKNQFADKASPLLFVKELVRITSTSTYRKIITEGKFTISSWIPGVVKMVAKLDDKEVVVYVNLTKKTKPIKRAKDGKVVLSTKAHKFYPELPKSLDAFEGIIISKKTDIAIKEKTKEIKLKKAEEQAEKNEIERAKQAKLDAAAAEIKAKEQAVIDAQEAKEHAKEAKLAAQRKARAEADRDKLLSEKEIIKEQKREEKEIEKTRVLELKELERIEKQKHDDAIKLKEAQEAKKAGEIQAKIDRSEERKTTIENNIIENEKEDVEDDKLIIKEERKEEKAELKAQQAKEKEAFKAERAIERTKQIELKELAKIEKQKENSEMDEAKAKAKAERDAAKEMKKNQDSFSIMEEEILESERTNLTEEDIAATTQIDPDEYDDFQAFLDGDEKNNKK